MLYPTYVIEGLDYPLPPVRDIISRIVGVLQTGLIIFAIFGNRI